MHASLSKRLKEGGFLLLLAIGAYFLMALFSYSPDDPSWVFESAKQHADNAGGVAGAWAASVLFMLFGKVAYVFPLMIAWGGWLMFRERDDQQHSVYLRIARWIGFVLTVLSATALASLRMGGVDSLPEGPGGITGDLISSSGTAVLNEAGAILLLLTLLLVGITLFAGVSWLAVMDGVGGFLLNVWRQGVGLLGSLAEKRQASRMKQERQEVVKKEKQRKRDKPPPVIEKKEPEIRTSVRVEKERQMTLLEPEPNTELPPLGLLDPPQKSGKGLSTEALQALSGQVERKLADFGVSAEVTAVHPGPVVTLFELQLAPGTKASKVTNLSKDLARALSVVSVRVVEVIPGKTVIGLEIPNEYREMVHLSETLRSEPYDRSKSPLTLALGKDIVGEPVVADLAKMPHALIAGTTGSGKSVAVNAMILSLVYKATAEEIRLIMIDPKMLELSVYEGIPHLLTPVVTDMKEAANALRWCVAEMERRYRLMAALGVRNIAGYNKKVKDAAKAGEPIKDPLFKREPDPITGDLPEIPDLKTIPYIVVVIDEFADMMMVVGKKVEELIARLAQKARAAGVHLLLATQRPSVDVITGLIKANIPTRIAFQVSSRVDSRTILDQ
ncbi:MAG: DNA translocase FtsK 4TM domain-containing protein, partial [Gammaproteobacteria bacterium]|nr:DNA translocase FtsK 4TM domain-containing protein [Gammaproteobacteria bacterium]